MRPILISAVGSTRSLTVAANAAAYNYTLRCLQRPDYASEFANKSRILRWLPGGVVFILLRLFGYNGLVFLHEDKDEVVGHVFFQKHSDQLHIFAFWRCEARRGSDCSLRMMREFLIYAWERGYKTVRLGTNRNRLMSHLRERVFRSRVNLPFVLIPGEDGWATLA